MYNTSLVRIHRLKTAVLSGFKHLGGNALRKSDKRFLTLFTVISDIYGDSVISAAVVCRKPRKVLNGVKCFAAVTDNGSETLAVKLYKGGIFFFGNFYRNLRTAEM